MASTGSWLNYIGLISQILMITTYPAGAKYWSWDAELWVRIWGLYSWLTVVNKCNLPSVTGSRRLDLRRIDRDRTSPRERNGGIVTEGGWGQVSRDRKLCSWVSLSPCLLRRVGRMWLCCGLKGHPAESPAFSCLTLNFSGKFIIFFCLCVCLFFFFFK